MNPITNQLARLAYTHPWANRFLRVDLDTMAIHAQASSPYLPAYLGARGTAARICRHEVRRFLLRCELDAAYLHLYGIERDDADDIMETFPTVKRKDQAAHGEYRTKRVILEIYDEMQRAMARGEPYQTRLDPPPADPRVAHAARESGPG